jgi:putative ABC transport system ATP-binding protein
VSKPPPVHGRSGEPPNHAEGAIIALEDVSRDFLVGSQTIRALRNVSLTVERGEFVAIIGRSGSGKTTLLNVIAGLDRPTSGRVLVEGLEVSAMNESQLTALRRRKLGFVFQSFGLLPLLSAYENVELALRIAGAGIRERGQRTAEMLDLVGLTKRADHRPYELSGGEQQRVAIARALANRPAIILADEPTGELDSLTASSIFGLLVEIVEREKVTVVTTTHDRLVMERAQRIVELSDGALVTAADKTLGVEVPVPAPWAPQPRAHDTAPAEPAHPEDDHERWARPERTARPIYQPPGPPREPL